MTEFLVNKFIKDSANIESTEVRTRYGMLASVVGIFCNVLLFSVKLAIGLILSSLAVTADAFNNLSDAASSIISFVGVKMAVLSGYTSFDAIFSGDAVNGVQLVVVLLLAAYVLVKIVFTEAGRVPVDDPRTHLELTMIHEVMCLDYCGVDLAYIKMAGWLKTAALSVLAADAVAATCCPRWWAAAPLAVLVTGLSVGIVESTQARNKLARNTTFILTVAALAVLVFFTGYLLQLNIGLQ